MDSSGICTGRIFSSGSELLRIDQSNYDLNLKIKKATLAQAQAAYSLEMGQQEIARDELKILEKTTGKAVKGNDLTLRKPQLAQALANLESAKAEIALAALNLTRTSLTAPFNALVLERNATLGNTISTQETLAALVSTDEYWIEISIPLSQLNWLNIPVSLETQGSKANIMMDGGRGIREGYILKNTGALDTQSRLATLIVSVKDPLLLAPDADKSKSPLVLHDYVRVSIEGKMLRDIIRVPRAVVRDGQTLWVLNDKKLSIRPVKIVFEDNDYAYIAEGIEANAQIISSNIPVPIEGMELVLKDDPKNAKQNEPTKAIKESP